MSRDSKVESPIAEQAFDWWVRLHDEGASPADHREFGAWVRRSPERIGAYFEVARLIQALESGRVHWPRTPADTLIQAANATRRGPLSLPGLDSDHAGMPPADTALPDAAVSTRSGRMRQATLHGYSKWLFATAVLFFLVVIGTSWYRPELPRWYTTQADEQRSILLADGSYVTLNAETRIEVKFRRARRVVRLFQGEALFHVAHDLARPFDVVVGKSVVRAVGTEFNIDLGGQKASITVIEGRVAVMPDADAELPILTQTEMRLAKSPAAGRMTASPVKHAFPAPAGSLILAAGERVVIADSRIENPEQVPNLAAVTGWVQRRLVFDHEPLAEVALQFNRYNQKKLVIEGANLARRKVTGVFRPDDLGSFLSFLSEIQGVEIRVHRGGVLVVTQINSSSERSSESESVMAPSSRRKLDH